MKKSRKLKPENITRAFRRFNGDLSIQIDGCRWIEIKSCKEADEMLRAKNTNQLEYVVIDEDVKIIDLKVNKYKNADPKILEEVHKIYRQG